MHRPALASCVLALCAHSATHAQSTVTIYGIADTGVEYLTNINAQGDSLKRIPNLTALNPSRLGFRGTEDLGDGLSAFFNLEMGLALDGGTLNNGGRSFGRAANVGLTGPLGRFTLGRQINMTVLAVSSNVIGPALYSIAALDSYIPNAINDNTLGYLGSFSGVTVGATYSLGRDVASAGGPAATNCPGETTGGACRQWTAVLKYDAPTFGAALSHDVMNGGPGAAFGLVSASDRDRRTVVSAWGRLGTTKIAGGVLLRDRKNATPLESTLGYLGVSQPLAGGLTLDAELSHLDVKETGNDSTMAVVRGVYALSKRTSVYAMLGHIENRGTAAVSVSAGTTVGVGMNQTGVMAGIRHVF